MPKQWCTEFVGEDGFPYVGPIILDESLQGAEAILTVLLGPSGQRLHITGQILSQRTGGDDTELRIRRVM